MSLGSQGIRLINNLFIIYELIDLLIKCTIES